MVGSWVLGVRMLIEFGRNRSSGFCGYVRSVALCDYHALTFEFYLLGSEMAVDKRYGKADKELGLKADEASEQAYSMRKRMSAFPRVDAEIKETPNLALPNHFPQNEGSSSLAGTFRRPVGVFQTRPSSSVSANCLHVYMLSDLGSTLDISGAAVPWPWLCLHLRFIEDFGVFDFLDCKERLSIFGW